MLGNENIWKGKKNNTEKKIRSMETGGMDGKRKKNLKKRK